MTTLFLTVLFGVVMYVWQFQIIDEMYDAQHIIDHIASMSDLQRRVHSWLTGTVDVAYPFAYAAFFIGVAIKSFGRYGVLLCVPSILCVPADLLEGFAQIMLLNDQENFIGLKVVATPIKLVLFITGLIITLIGLLKLYLEKRRKS